MQVTKLSSGSFTITLRKGDLPTSQFQIKGLKLVWIGELALGPSIPFRVLVVTFPMGSACPFSLFQLFLSPCFSPSLILCGKRVDGRILLQFLFCKASAGYRGGCSVSGSGVRSGLNVCLRYPSSKSENVEKHLLPTGFLLFSCSSNLKAVPVPK